MTVQDLLTWTRATPFQPFRMTMNSGKAFEVRHPELVRLMPSSLMFFTPSTQPGVYDRAEMIGLVLIERIEPLELASQPKNGPA